MHQPGGGYEQLGHRPIAYEPELVVGLAQVGLAGGAGCTVSARDHPFDDHVIAGLDACSAARLDDNATPLVTDNDGVSDEAGVDAAVDYVEVGTADPDHDWTDQDIPGALSRRIP